MNPLESDSDYAYALLLQAQLDEEDRNSSHIVDTSNRKDSTYTQPSHVNEKEISLVDPSWELTDPNPDARMLFLQFNDRFFWGRLAGVEVRWSPRMTLCAGLCVYEGRGGLCSVRLSLPLLKLRPRKDLVETLLHEMIHAYLFVTDNNKDHDGHGPEFHKHMYRINNEAGTSISVYHTFHDEVDNYRQHWWRCNGPCQKKPPYFGYVKRAMNRAPSARDPWWADHQRSCGGTYTKIKEPEGYGQKKKKQEEKSISKKETETSKGNGDIRNMFGKIAGGKSSPPSTNNSKTKMPIPVSGSVKGSNINGISSGSTSQHVVPKSNSSKSSNISGFKRGENGDELDVWRDSCVTESSSKVDNFQGQGHKLSNWKGSPPSSGKIVRKLPGIGVVETVRRDTNLLLNEKVNTDVVNGAVANDDDDEDDTILVYSPTCEGVGNFDKNKKSPKTMTDQHNKSTSKSPARSPNKKDIRNWFKETVTAPVTKTPDISDSDTEFDNQLKNSAKAKKRSKSMNKTNDKSKMLDTSKSMSKSKSLSNMDRFVEHGLHEKSAVGTKKSIPGFKSVSNHKHTPPKDRMKSETSRNNPWDGSDRNDGSFISERNKRALDLGGSDSSDDIDALERQTLASVISKRRKINKDNSQLVEADKYVDKSPKSTTSPTDKRNGLSQSTSHNSDIAKANVHSGDPTNSGPGANIRDMSVQDNYNANSAVSPVTVQCPVCQVDVEAQRINEHLDNCLS